MRVLVTILIAIVVLVGVGYGFMEFYYVYPDEVGQEYMDKIISRDYQQLSDYFHSEAEAPSAAELELAFNDFAAAYGLTKIELIGMNPVDETFTTAEYTIDLRYESQYFAPLMVQFNLNLGWDGLFTWKVIWEDTLPLPEYGIEASYRRARIEPNRGKIYDHNDNLLAGQGSIVAIGVQPGRVSDPELLYSVLGEHLGLSQAYIESRYQAPGVEEHWFVSLTTVTEEQYQELNPVLRPIPGVFFQRQPVRYYPLGMAGAHLTGYIGEVSETMITQYPERDYLIGESGGRSGLEAGLEDVLRGVPGYQLFVTTAEAREQMLLEQEVIQGEDVILTIDARMQEIAMEVLAEVKGALVVLDGEILTLASTPSYDPNEFARGISNVRWQELSSNRDQPLFNRALQGRYAPGSVFKVLTAAAALDLGVYQITSEFDDTGELWVEGNIVRNFQNAVFGKHYFADAVIKSINTTMAQVGLTLGADNLNHYFELLDLQRQPEVPLPAVAGSIGNPAQSKVSLAWTAIGQDKVLLTPLHIASIFTAFVNEEGMPQPQLIKTGNEPQRKQVFTASTQDLIRAMLEQVVREGTGQLAAVDGLNISGKTGTAEVAQSASHGWFAGIASDGLDSNLAFALLVEEGGLGGGVAAPLISEFFARLLAESNDELTVEDNNDKVISTTVP